MFIIKYCRQGQVETNKNIETFESIIYLRLKRNHFPCFHTVIRTLVEV